jgi:hypothetical protein
MPWDYEETVRIDAEDILDYVKDNKDWFLDKLGEDDFVYKKKMQELSQVIHNMCNDEFDFLRKVRDGTSKLSDKEIIEKCKNLYSTIEALGNYFGDYAKD